MAMVSLGCIHVHIPAAVGGIVVVGGTRLAAVEGTQLVAVGGIPAGEGQSCKVGLTSCTENRYRISYIVHLCG